MPYMDDDVRARVAELVEEIETSSFRETKWGRRGYSERDVDEFLDYLVDVLFALLSSSTPAFAGAEPEHEPEVLPLEDTELHVDDGIDATEVVAAPDPEPHPPHEEGSEETELVSLPEADEPPRVDVESPAAASSAPEAEVLEVEGAPSPSPPKSEGTPLPPWIGPNG